MVYSSRDMYRRADAERNSVAVQMLQRAASLAGHERAMLRGRVVVSYLRVADMVAARFSSTVHERSDIRQVACVGLAKAAQRFSPQSGTDFVAFAVPTITGEIKRFLRDTTWDVRPPRKLQDLASTLDHVIPEMMHVLGHEPTVNELAESLERPPALIREARLSRRARRAYSLDAPLRAEGGIGLHALLTQTDDSIERADLALLLHAACRVLTLTQRKPQRSSIFGSPAAVHPLHV